MASDTESVNERVNLTRELTEEEQDIQMDKVKKFVGELADMQRRINDIKNDMFDSIYNKNANVFISRENPVLLQPSLDSYAETFETHEKRLTKVIEKLYLIAMGLLITFNKQLDHKRANVLYHFVCLEFEKVFDIIDNVLQFSAVVCDSTNNKKTFKKWVRIYEQYFKMIKKVSRVYDVVYKEFDTLFHALTTQYMFRLDEISHRYNDAIELARESYDAFRTNEYRSRFSRNQPLPNHNGGRSHKKRVKRFGRTHKKRA